jgi:hypothetical protein
MYFSQLYHRSTREVLEIHQSIGVDQSIAINALSMHTGYVKDVCFLFAFRKKILISLFFHVDSENDLIFQI